MKARGAKLGLTAVKNYFEELTSAYHAVDYHVYMSPFPTSCNCSLHAETPMSCLFILYSTRDDLLTET